jgi:hypothetical protein
METQLRDRYLGIETRQGIYVVGWFASEGWPAADNRRRRCARRSKDEWKVVLDRQATQLTAEGNAELAAFLLDCSLPPRSGPSGRE